MSTKPRPKPNNAPCCGGVAAEHFAEPSEPSQSIPPVKIEEKKTSEDKEAKKARLAGGALAKSLLDDSKVEPLPPGIRRPGESLYATWKPPPPKPKKAPLPVRDNKYNEELEQHLNHLPFFTQKRYDRLEILKKIRRIKPLRGMFHKGRYFIDKDRQLEFDPRMNPEALDKFLKKQSKIRRKFRADGRENRIVELFMDKVMGWSISNDLLPPSSMSQGNSYCFLWLGPHLAYKMLSQFSHTNDVPPLFQAVARELQEKEFFIINRLPLTTVFKDKENFYGMLAQYIMSSKLTCKNRPVDECLCQPISKEDCHDLEAKGIVTRTACVHQNLSLSLKPCLVKNCNNFEKRICSHMYAFIPETITLNSYTSMLYFSERFNRVEDLKGCIFITKPAYLCNGRGIKFIVNIDQFEHFYHMNDGKATTRHGVILQRYIECPRLFDRKKFTIRFFLLIIVLENRRVIGFIHYGVARFAKMQYQPVAREDFDANEEVKEGRKPNKEVPVEKRSIGRVTTEKFPNDIHLTGFLTPKQKALIREEIYTGKAVLLHPDEDNTHYVEDILPKKCKLTASIYIQMLFASQCIMSYLQSAIQDYPGCFQTISIDSIVDARNKLWILEAGTKIFSGFVTIAPRQRQIMSAILQETIGITIECFYKSRSNLPLYWDYVNERPDYDAVYFSQDFNLFFETDRTRQTGFLYGKKPPSRSLLLEERYEQVDSMREAAHERRMSNLAKKKKLISTRNKYRAMVKAKAEEES